MRSLTNLYTQEQLDTEVRALAVALEAGQLTDGQVGQLSLLHADGRCLQFEYRLKVAPSAAGHGRCLLFARALSGSTEATRLMTVQAKEVEQLKLMLDNVPAMVYSYESDENNQNARFPVVSIGAQLVYGIAPEAIMEDAGVIVSVIHSDDVASFVSSVSESWETLMQWNWTGRFKVPSGEYKWMRCSSKPRRLPNKHTVWYGAVWDVNAAVELEEAKADLDSLVRSANAPIFEIDPHGRLASCNPTTAVTLGYAPEDVIGKPFVDFVPAASREGVGQVLAAALGGEETEGYDLVLLSKAGKQVEVLLNATARQDTSGSVLGIVCVGQDVTRVRRQLVENKRLLAEKDTVADKYARALDNLTDVVFEVSASSWEADDWRLGEHSSSFRTLFSGHTTSVLDLVNEPDAMAKLLRGARDDPLSKCEMSVVKHDSSKVHTVDFQAVNISTPTGRPCVLVVCHDLTDFKFRVEVEKDRQVAAKLQHEDKNTHKAQEVGAHYALEQLHIIEAQLVAQNAAAAQFQSLELKQVWLDLASVRETSFVAIRQAGSALRTLEGRSQRAQEESHTRIMMYQLVADEYVPALTPTDVVARLQEEFHGASDVCLRAFDVPEVHTDWTLLWFGLENALSNARKYGLRREPIEFALEYREPKLTIVVTNIADRRQQAKLIASHGRDATTLLLRRVEGGGKHSTNLGGHALRDVARLMHGSVSLQLSPDATKLTLEVRAERTKEVVVTETLLAYFIDDEPTMRMVYTGWLRPPSPLHPNSKVFPPHGLSPDETDEAMRSFASAVIGASPQPNVVVLDQNLRSQVTRRSNVTTGTDIARSLREQGYRGVIVIRSANISTRSMQEYLAAGADAAMTKDEPREKLLRIVNERTSSSLLVKADDADLDAVPLLADISHEGMTVADRDAIMETFRHGARATLGDLRTLLDDADLGALPDELHYLLGQCRAVGARRMQQAVVGCKERFGYVELGRLEGLLAQTMQASDARAGKVPSAEAGTTGAPIERRPSTEQDAEGGASSLGKAEEAPLVVEHVALRMGKPILNVGTQACHAEIAHLRLAVTRGESTQLLLHSLCGDCESMGAARLARRCAELKQRGDVSVGLEEVNELDALLHATEAAIGKLNLTPAQPDAAAAEGVVLAAAFIDDSNLSRKMMRHVMFPVLRVDTARSGVLGETRAEQLGFIDFALGRIDAQLRPLAPPHQPVDLVVLDQNIMLDSKAHLFGSVLVEQLRAHGYAGIACITTADNESIGRLGAASGVDLAVPKSADLRTLAAKLRKMATDRRLVPLSTASGSTPAGSTPAVAKPALIDLSHFMGIGLSAVKPLITAAYDSNVASLAGKLNELQAAFGEGAEYDVIAHTLFGNSKTAGANLLASEVKAFRSAPTAAGIDAMWSALDACRRQMKADGLLPADVA